MDIEFLDSENNLIKNITQWDVNRKLKIKPWELEKTPMIHFYNNMITEALVVPSQKTELNELVVNVPNILLQQNTPLKIAIFLEDSAKEGKTTYIKEIPIISKAKPEDYVFTENIEYANWVELSEQAKQELIEMQNIINETQQKLDSGAFIGPQGPAGKDGGIKFEELTPEQKELLRGPQGLPGEPGKNGVDGKPGEKGQTGENGITPTIGANGNWFLGIEDTGKPSRGVQGEPGKDGVNGGIGPQGLQGEQGKSAYQIWLNNGNQGTEQDFLNSLKGEPGIQGEPGKDADMSQIYTKTEIDNKIGNINTVLSTLTNVGGV